MSQKTLSGSIALSKLIHVKMKVKNKEGKEILGIFIPFEANKLVILEKTNDSGKTEVSVFMPVRIVLKEEKDKYGNNGFISKTLSTEEYKKLITDSEKEESKKLSPILGNLKDFSNNNNSSSNDASGAVSNNFVDPYEDNDLPL